MKTRNHWVASLALVMAAIAFHSVAHAQDADADGVADSVDNCPSDANADQADADLDLVGDVCDNCPDSLLNTSLEELFDRQLVRANGSASRSSFLRVSPTSLTDSRVGSAFLRQTVVLPESEVFETSFRARIYQGSGGDGAHGMTFVLHNDPRGESAIGSTGSGLGYGGIDNSVAIEFDTKNSNNGDPNDNHIAILTGGRAGIHVALEPNPGLDFNGVGSSGFYVWVDYNGATDLLRVYLSATNLSGPAYQSL